MRVISIKLLVFLIVAAFQLTAASSVFARIGGLVDFSFIDFTSRGANSNNMDARSFSQRYSVFVNKDYANSTGRKTVYYDYSLGYQWLSFDTKIKTDNSSADTMTSSNMSSGRVTYFGELEYDPVTLPLFVQVYSRDLVRSSIQNSEIAINGQKSILGTMLPSDISTPGTNIQSGAKIVFGVKDGFRSKYSEYIGTLPMIMIDFKDTIVKNRSTSYSSDNRLSELAFVSLNKRDNWFHFRYKTYMDNILPQNNWTKKEYQLGSVNERRSRKWIDLTNWIRVSADGQYSEYNAANNIDSITAYNVNLFATATRKAWSLNTFTSLSRETDNNGVTTIRNIPIYLSGYLSPDTSWTASAALKDEQNSYFTGGISTDSSRQFAGRVVLFSRQKFTLTPAVKIENIHNSSGNSLDINASIETSSTRRFSSKSNISARYQLHGNLNDRSIDEYLDQNLRVVSGYQNEKIRIMVSESVALKSRFNDTLNIGNSFMSQSDASASYYLNSKVDASANLFHTYTDDNSGSINQTMVSAGINYNPDHSFKFNLKGSYMLSSGNSESGLSRTYNVSALTEYMPIKNITNKILYDDSIDISNNYRKRTKTVNQLFKYSWMPSFLMSRRFMDIEEEYKFTQDSIDITNSYFKLGARCYPSQRLSLYGNVTIYASGYDQYTYNAGTNIDFRMMQASLDYAYGKRTGDQRIEKRITANVRRSF